MIRPIQDKVYDAINKVAKNNGLDFIFDKSGELLMLVSNSKYDRSDEVLEDPRSKVLEQVSNGVAVRMACLKKLILKQ